MELNNIAARGDDSISLEKLLADVVLGSRQAFETLYHQTSRQLFAICLRVLTQRADAEEVLQEVFATVWRKAAQYDAGRAGAMAWLAMIARNKSIDRLRTLSSGRQIAPLELAEEIADPAASPQLDAQAAADRARLELCMQELEGRRRSLIRAAFFEGSTYEELAARIGSPLGSVKSWIRRGLLQLRECLER